MAMRGSRTLWTLGWIGALAASLGAAPLPPRVAPDGVWEIPPASPGSTWLRILHVNDLHGHVFPRKYFGENLPPSFLGKEVGGLFSLGTYLDRLRRRSLRRAPLETLRALKKGDDGVMVLDAGDWIGGALYDSETQGASTVEVLSDPALDVDATVLGNHSWDYWRQGLESAGKLFQSRVPVVTANVDLPGDPHPWKKPGAILTSQGIRIGVVGLLIESGLHSALPAKTEGVKIHTFHESLGPWVAEQAKAVDFQIFVTHVGFERDKAARATLEGLLEDHPEWKVALVLDGHSHRDSALQLRDGTWVLQADHFATRMGEVLLEVGPDGSPTGEIFHRRVILDSKRFPPLASMLRRHRGRIEERNQVEEGAVAPAVPGFVAKALPRPVPKLISPCGDLIAQLMWLYAKEHLPQEVDFTSINQGGVRQGLYADGPQITQAALHAVMPFRNRMALVEAKGSRFRDYLEDAIQHRFRSSFRGLELVVQEVPGAPGEPPLRKLEEVWIVSDSGTREPLDPEKTYRLYTGEYIAAQVFEKDPEASVDFRVETDFEVATWALEKVARELGPWSQEILEKVAPPQIRFLTSVGPGSSD